MPELDITAAGEHAYDVTITDDAGTETRHHVTVPTRFLTDLGLAAAQEPTLVRASMRYLLEREPPASILSAFSLDDVTRYFPDYPAEITTLL
jgi:hypothetical protein